MKLFRQILINLPFILAGCTGATYKSSQLHMTPIEHLGEHYIVVPTNFIHQITSANVIVVKPIIQDPRLQDIQLVLTGKDAQDVIRAISLLKNDRYVGVEEMSCGCVSWNLRFYHGTNYLGSAFSQDNLVELENEYFDSTGTFQKIQTEMLDKENERLRQGGHIY